LKSGEESVFVALEAPGKIGERTGQGGALPSWPSGLGGGRGVQTGAIPADNLGPGVRQQPLFCALRASVR
jgi:hypothetical protein